jgi:NHLM bacteriocin system ABC transporter peptidase/ATP-binding protein
MEAAECGPAALGIVLAHYGRYAPLEQLRVDCGVSRDGSNAANMLRAARSYGLTAKGMQMEADVVRDQQLPAIAFWEFRHFVVVEGFGNDKVFLNDPASGPRTVTWDEFDNAFTGVLLTLSPDGQFERGGEPPSTWKGLRRRLDTSALTLILLVSLMLVVPGVALAGFQRVFIDDVLRRGQTSWIVPIVLGALVVGAVAIVLTWMQQQYLLRLETRIAVLNSARFLRHVLRLPVEFFAQRQVADIAYRVRSIDFMAQVLSRDLATAVVSSIVAGFYAIVALTGDLVLGLLGIALTSLNVVALQLVARRRGDAARQMQQDQGKLVASTYLGLQLLETLKATGREPEYFARWSGHLAKYVSGVQRLGEPTRLLAAVPVTLATANVALILLVGSHEVVGGDLTIGLLVAIQTLLASFAAPIKELSGLGGRAQLVGADLARIDDVERYPVAPAFAHPGTEGKERLTGRVELDNVAFGYSPLAPPLIENLSLRLDPGQRVAFVGGSGSGKSTVARLIAGLLEPWSGEIRLDGTARGRLTRPVLAASIGMVSQDIFVFEGSIRDNLTLWDEDVPDEVLIEALRDAALYDEIMGRSGRLNGRTTEGGSDLSGGQRQRLEIARTLVGDPSLVILDEATSALDTASEQHVDASLRRRGCACVIVAHRLSTIRDAEEILVFDRGAVVQRGTHEEMKDADGPYRELIR